MVVGECPKLLLFDLLQSNASAAKHYDLLIDKGTWDAISLNPDVAVADPSCSSSGNIASQERILILFSRYYRSLQALSSDKSTLIITSCNFTRSEILDLFQFAASQSDQMSNLFKLKDEIPHSSFQFGGAVGQTVTTLVFGCEVNK
jgi:hypothetical protein